jgi:hypothetical protein
MKNLVVTVKRYPMEALSDQLIVWFVFILQPRQMIEYRLHLLQLSCCLPQIPLGVIQTGLLYCFDFINRVVLMLSPLEFLV